MEAAATEAETEKAAAAAPRTPQAAPSMRELCRRDAEDEEMAIKRSRAALYSARSGGLPPPPPPLPPPSPPPDESWGIGVDVVGHGEHGGRKQT